MHKLRNPYLWMTLASLAFVLFSYRVSLHRPTKADIAACEASDEEIVGESERIRSCTPLSPYATGFLTVVILGGFWYTMHSQVQASMRED